MDFKKYLKKTAKELDGEVDGILKEQLEEAKKTDKKLIPLIKTFAKSCQGGKRIRGALVKLGYELASVKRKGESVKGKKEIIKIGAAYEIIHTAILAHDDIIDKSLIRREKPSLYAALGNNHYGISQAISLADYGFFLAFKIISDNIHLGGVKAHLRGDKAAGLFSRTMIETAFGQMLELKKANPFLVMKLKTACYTIAGPLQIGAVLGGADQKLISVLGEFGESLGTAYQIKDDILDGDAGSLKTAESYIDKAMNLLPEITRDKKMSKILEQMAEYLVRRTK